MNPVSFDTNLAPPAMAGAESLPEGDRKKLWGASRELEAVFNGYLLGDLGNKLPGTSDSFSGQVYAGFFKDTLSHHLADGQHNGIARQLYQQLTHDVVQSQQAQSALSQPNSET